MRAGAGGTARRLAWSRRRAWPLAVYDLLPENGVPVGKARVVALAEQAGHPVRSAAAACSGSCFSSTWSGCRGAVPSQCRRRPETSKNEGSWIAGESIMTAVKTPWRQSMPDFLQFLDGTLGHKVKLHKEVLGYDLYLVDLSDWKLRFSDRTPLIIVKEARSGVDECPRARAEPRRGGPRPVAGRAQPHRRRAGTRQSELKEQLHADVPAAAGAGRGGRAGRARVAAALGRIARPARAAARPVAPDALRDEQARHRLALLRPGVRGAPHPADAATAISPLWASGASARRR